MAKIHFVQIDYDGMSEEEEESTSKIVYALQNRAIQTSRNSFIYINEYEFKNYLDDLYSEINSAIEKVIDEENYNQIFISSLSLEELEYQFNHLQNEYNHILSK